MTSQVNRLPIDGYSNCLHKRWWKTHPMDNHLPNYLYKMSFREFYDKVKLLPYFGHNLKFKMYVYKDKPHYNTLRLDISKDFISSSILKIITDNFDCYINCGELLFSQIIIRQKPDWVIQKEKQDLNK